MKIVTYSPQHLSFFVDEENEEEDREHHDSETEFLQFSPNEEYAMAMWVMDAYCTPWIDTKPEFQTLLFIIIKRKSQGKDITGKQFTALVDYYERYKNLLPPFPKLKDDGKHVTLTKAALSSFMEDSAFFLNVPAKSTFNFEEFIAKIRSITTRAWYETWDQHPFMRKRAGMYVFPHSEPDDQYIALQKKMEVEFWAEVNRKQQQYDCELTEAISIVSDYLPRAEEKYRTS